MKIINDFIKDGDSSIFNMMLYGAKLEPVQENIINNCLASPQLKGIITAEMGLGKTYIGITLTQIALALTGKKALITVPKNKVSDFYKLCKDVLGVKVQKTSGLQKEVDKMIANFNNTDVIVASQSAWVHSMDFNIFMYNNVDKIGLSFYDEADMKNSAGFMAYCEFSRIADVSFIANATPVSKDIKMTYNLLYAVGATDLKFNKFKSRYSKSKLNKNTGKVQETILLDELRRDFAPYFINKNRSDLGVTTTINSTFIRAVALPIQKRWMDEGVREDLALYSPGTRIDGASNTATVPALDALVKTVLRSNATDNKIIYAKNTDTIKTIYTILTTIGHKVYILDGKHAVTDEDKKKVEEDFNAEQGAICITNILKGSNLGSANEVIIYGVPDDILQTVHRAIRGFTSKTINLTWIYYKDYDKYNLIKSYNSAYNSLYLLDRKSDLIEDLSKELRSVYPGVRINGDLK